jgi:hypothetical protein
MFIADADPPGKRVRLRALRNIRPGQPPVTENGLKYPAYHIVSGGVMATTCTSIGEYGSSVSP